MVVEVVSTTVSSVASARWSPEPVHPAFSAMATAKASTVAPCRPRAIAHTTRSSVSDRLLHLIRPARRSMQAPILDDRLRRIGSVGAVVDLETERAALEDARLAAREKLDRLSGVNAVAADECSEGFIDAVVAAIGSDDVWDHKGVEYDDAVVVHRRDMSPSEVCLAASRAAHQLWIVSTRLQTHSSGADPSPAERSERKSGPRRAESPLRTEVGLRSPCGEGTIGVGREGFEPPTPCASSRTGGHLRTATNTKAQCCQGLPFGAVRRSSGEIADFGYPFGYPSTLGGSPVRRNHGDRPRRLKFLGSRMDRITADGPESERPGAFRGGRSDELGSRLERSNASVAGVPEQGT